MRLDPLEAAVIEMLLDGDHPVLATLRSQVPLLSVTSRKLSGSGFFTEFAVTEKTVAAEVPTRKIRFGDVEAAIPGLKYGAGFVLYVDEGIVRMLEGYSFEEPWPEVVSEFSLRYSDASRKAVSKNFG